mmetsp:Transcript_5800/g.6443  ORF Transcript_5800/g.6443 Transcript_5800/m.6443 type:complete len:413 (-) Transcript_5800:1387-2625(-)
MMTNYSPSYSSCRILSSISLIILCAIIITTTIDSILTIDGFCTESYHISWKRKVPNIILAEGKGGWIKYEQYDRGGGLYASEKGFGTISNEADSSPPLPVLPDNKYCGRKIYSMPALYDMAFGYRNFEEEVDFLMDQHRLLNEGQAPRRILELAAGPARHSIDALKAYSYVESVTALDNSAEMIDYAKEIAVKELTDDNNDSDNNSEYNDKVDCFNYIQADMSNFTILPAATPSSQLLFDSAWILLGSLQHLTTNPQVISCFNCIHRVLQPGGTLILELPHPRETFSLVECTRNGWDIPLEDENGNISGELKIVWGDDNDSFDPIKQVRQFTVSMKLTGNHALQVSDGTSDNSTTTQVSEVVPMRHFTSQEIDVLAQITGFEVMSMHGAVAHDVNVNDDDEAFRLVCVLQKQ